MNKLKVLVVGCGNMGTSHAKAYYNMEEFEIVGLVSRSSNSRDQLATLVGSPKTFSNFDDALVATQPDVVSINTYPDTHYEYTISSLKAGANVFVEKPLATNLKDCQHIIDLASAKQRKVVVGYILRVHPAWSVFVEEAQKLGKPVVMRMNLNQQSSGSEWNTHQNLLESLSPIVDCGVHYLDIMCLMTKSEPESVHAIGVNLSTNQENQKYNYGQLQVKFKDGSVGWYEAGWGPMISENAFFIKDVFGPKGSVSIEDKYRDNSKEIEGHTKTGSIRVHHSQLDQQGNFEKEDTILPMSNEPTHDELCELEQQYLLQAIQEDLDLSKHLLDAKNSLQIALAADESVKSGKVVLLGD